MDTAALAQDEAQLAVAPLVLGGPLPGLSAEELALFAGGKEAFEEVETVADGLGPVFNGASCAECHKAPATGGGSDVLETRFGAVATGTFDALASKGGPLVQEKGIGAQGPCQFDGEVVPPEATVASKRRTTPLFGLGLVDAVPEGTFHYVARFEALFFPEQAGRPGMVRDIARGRLAVGRFGWKGQVPSLHQFAGDAYLNEMGITSPEFPQENCPQGRCDLLACNPVPALNDDGTDVAHFENFMRLLAPPRRAPTTPAIDAGRRLFSQAGCTRCHWSTFFTGWSPSPALRRRIFHPYSDFMLHDMGSLGDGVETGSARGSEFRTAPLWGLRAVTRFLHDGRAATPAEAIRAHDGQGRRARERFEALTAGEQAALVQFLESL